MTAHTGTLRSALLAGIMTVLLLANQSQATPDNIRVTLLNPSTPSNLFWNMQTQFAQAAAADLGVDLEIVYGADNRFHTTQQAYDMRAKNYIKPVFFKTCDRITAVIF